MLHFVTVRTGLAAAAAALLAGHAAAVTLGSPRGAVLVGRPLAVSVPVTLDAPDEPCASAELLHGEQRVASPSVRWEGTGGLQGVLRVTSPVAVDEASVTLTLRVGCGGNTSIRRYVLLAELPEQGRVLLPVVPQATPPAAPASRESMPVAPPRRAAAAPAPAPRAAPPRVVPVPRKETPAPGPRLEVAPLDLTTEVSPRLRLELGLATQPTEDARVRESAAALWEELQRAPEQALQDAVRLQTVQGELEAVRQAHRQNMAAVQALQARAEAQQQERGRMTLLLVALGVALALALVLLAWRWRRSEAAAATMPAPWFEAAPAAGTAAVAGTTVPGEEPSSAFMPSEPMPDRPVLFADSTPADLPPRRPQPPAPSRGRFGDSALQTLDAHEVDLSDSTLQSLYGHRPSVAPSTQPPSTLPPSQIPTLVEEERRFIPPPSMDVGVDIDLTSGDDPDELPPLDFDVSGFDAPADPKKN